MKFELWKTDDDSHALFGVPRETRLHEALEPGAVLLLRIETEDWEEAKQIRDRFLFEGNPDNLTALNIPLEMFLLHKYPCGLSVGEKVTFRKPYLITVSGRVALLCPGGTEAEVLPGDIEYPHIIWLETVGNEKILSVCEDEAQQLLQRR